MFKLLIVVGLGVAGYFVVKRILAEDTGAVEADHYYNPPETPRPAD